VDGPLTNATVTYAYDKLGRRIRRAINGVELSRTFDAAGRVSAETNALGSFTCSYDGASSRIVSEGFPNNFTVERSYKGVTNDLALARITHKIGATPLSEFLYDRDTPRRRIASWSQQPGAQPASRYAFVYDAMDQLLSVSVTNSGTLVQSSAYTYDAAGNRLSEVTDGVPNLATYNSLNQISSTTGAGNTRTNEWDADDRLVSVTTGTNRTEMAYDGLGRLSAIRQLVNGIEVSSRKLLWCDNELCEERDGTGATVTRRYFDQGMLIESGPQAGAYYCSRDHLGSVRELTDSGGNLRARYAYDPYGRQTRIAGDVTSDFGFAGMFTLREAGLASTRFRAYDPDLGRWLSRDPLDRAELSEGPNLYTYVGDDPVNRLDPLGLECCGEEYYDQYRALNAMSDPYAKKACDLARRAAAAECKLAHLTQSKKAADAKCAQGNRDAENTCSQPQQDFDKYDRKYRVCTEAHCNRVCRTYLWEGERREICSFVPK